MTIKQGNVILNEVKNLIKSINYETLRFTQGDKNMDFSNASNIL
jgi:hypothetical protein